MKTHSSLTRTTAFATGVVVLSVVAGGMALSARSDAHTPNLETSSCTIPQTPTASIKESTAFTPYADQRSHLVPMTLLESGVVPVSESEFTLQQIDLPGARNSSVAGEPLRFVTGDPEGSVALFYGSQASLNQTSDSFLASGGILVTSEPVANPDENYAAYLLKELGPRAVRVDVNGAAGALVWADPNSAGVRTHSLYWSTPDHNHSVVADMSANQLVDLVAVVACAPVAVIER